MMKRLSLALAAILVVTFAGIPTSAQQQPQQKSTIIQRIIVKVNGEIFTQTELEFRQIQALRDQNRPVKKAEDLTTDPGLAAALAEVTPALLVEAVDELMLVQHGREIGVKFNDSTFTKALEDLKKANNITDEAQFQAALKQEGITMSDLRVNIERAFFKQQVQQRELMRNMTLTEEEARQYYNTHKEEFVLPAALTLREIGITVATSTVNGQSAVNVAADEDAKAKLAAVRERAIKGEDFVKLVAEVSDSGTKANGGLVGPVAVADLNPSLAAVLEKLKPGDISELIRTKTGYQVFKLETRTGTEPETFEKSRDAITQKILEKRLDVEQRKFIQKLLTQAIIEWKDDSYRKLYEAGRAARANPGVPAPAPAIR